MPKIKKVAERRADKAAASVGATKTATILLPRLMPTLDQDTSVTNLGVNALESLTVETPGHASVIVMNPSVHDMLGINVSPSNREIIINGQYLDIGCLLETNMRERNDMAIMLVNGVLSARERSSPKLNSIEQWTDVFIIVMNIYVGAYPDKIHQLLKYIH